MRIQIGGQFLCEIYDANGCFSYELATIVEPSAITTSTSSINPSGSGSLDGEATVVANGGTPPYSYSWDDPNYQTSATATGLNPGTYNVTVIDANGCTESVSVELAGPVSIHDHISSISIYPNPVKNQLNIDGEIDYV